MSDNAVFGDVEPEDAWDANDTIPEQVENLKRRVALLIRNHHRYFTGSVHAQLDQIARLVRRARRGRLSERDHVRADQLDEDIAYIRSRL